MTFQSEGSQKRGGQELQRETHQSHFRRKTAHLFVLVFLQGHIRSEILPKPKPSLPTPNRLRKSSRSLKLTKSSYSGEGRRDF